MAKKNELAVLDSFNLPAPFEGMSQEDMDEFRDELADLDEGTSISCLQVKIPSGGGIAFEIEDGDGEVDSVKAIDAVIVFTHRMNAWWRGSYGDDDGNKAPVCSSMDAKVGLHSETGEFINCETCPLNQYGSDASGGKGKACKNMRRIYFMRQDDPNFYCLTVPPTSIRDVNRQLARIMGAKKIPYTGLIVTFKLEKAKNANGIAYSKVLVEKKGILPAAAAQTARAYRKEILTQYKAIGITMDEYVTAPSEQQAQNGGPAAEAAQPVRQAEFVEVQSDAADGEFPPLPFG